MDDAPYGLRNDFKAAVAFILPTEPVSDKIKYKISVAKISAMATDENKIGGGNFPRGGNVKEGKKQGGNLKSGVRKCSVPLRYHKLAA